MSQSSVKTIRATVLLSLFIAQTLAQLPPLLPRNEKEFRSTIDDISYSVKKITSPDFKVNPTFLNQFFRTLEAPSAPQPPEAQGPNVIGNTLGSVGKFMLNVVRWSVDLAKAIKQNKLMLRNSTTNYNHQGGNTTQAAEISPAEFSKGNVSLVETPVAPVNSSTIEAKLTR